MSATHHTLSVLVENRAGVLARVSNLFARRGYNIFSLAVAPTDDERYSRITIVVDVESAPLEQVTKQLFKLINVVKISELDPADSVERELLLCTVKAAPEVRGQVIELVQVFEGRILGVGHDELTLSLDGHPSKIYVRTVNTQAATTAIDNLLGYQANPENPNQVTVSQPSDALTAQADAKSALGTLFLGLGAVALLVGAIGVANIMVISVLERRSEIGLRRALGTTRGQIRAQFLAEAILLSLAGGIAGVATGVAATAIYARGHRELLVIPAEAWAGGLAAAVVIGAAAGLLPAIRASRLSPTQALWTM